jgi:polyisoprenoid-binding protein YceI
MRRAKGTIHVFTFKEGVLSAVAHDLRLHVDQFAITLEGEAVTAELDLKSIHLDGPVRDGVVNTDEYDAGKRADVEKAMHEDILHTNANPKSRFTGRALPQGDGFKVSGDLDLCGKTAPLAFDVSNAGGIYKAAFEFQPSRWGIAQYKAMLGAIKLKDVIRIEIALTDA